MLNTIFQAIDHLKLNNQPICIAIDGRCGSGKTTLADALQRQYDCNVFHMDDFFLPPELRTPERYNEPGGNVDYSRFKNDVLLGIKSQQPFEYAKFSCKQMEMVEKVKVEPKKISFIEGSYSMHPMLRDAYDLKIFLSIPYSIQCERIRKRNGQSALQTFIDRWIPLENKYFDAFNIEKQCDLVFDTNSEILLSVAK